MFEHNKTVEISYTRHMFLKQGSFFRSRLNHIMRSFIL